MKKKVVIFSAFATPFRSGAEACAEEISALLQGRYDITIVTARMSRDLPHLDHLESGVKVWRVGIGHSIDKWLYPFLAPRAAKALRPDIIHAVLETFAGLALKLYGKNVRRILTLQTTNRSFLKGSIIQSADTVTAISSALVRTAQTFGKNAALIPNGIRLKELQAARSKHPKIDGRILYVGRLEKMKGIDTLLQAFEKLQAARRKTQDSFDLEACSLSLRIVGDGSERRSLEALAVKLGISDRITFTGRLSPERVASEYAQAPIFCGLSRSEALGNVFLEAQAAGCAVLATNVGGIPDSVENGKTGILIEPDNVHAAVHALENLLADEALRDRLVQAGEKHAETYDWSVIAERYAGLWDSNNPLAC